MLCSVKKERNAVVLDHYQGNGNSLDKNVEEEMSAVFHQVAFFNTEDGEEEVRIEVDPEKLSNYAQRILHSCLKAKEMSVGDYLVE